MASSPTISAIIPLYNGGKYIREALESVFAQTLPPKEIIVVDDGSTDDGPEIVEKIKGNQPVTLLRKQNGGQSSARNYGVRHSTGDLIALLDQDDVWYPTHLEELVEPFLTERRTPLGWAYSNLDMTDEAGRIAVPRHLDHSSSHPKTSIHQCIIEDMTILPSASLISREAFLSVKGFDERLSGYEDDDLFLRLLRAGFDNVYIDKPLSAWRQHAASSQNGANMIRSAAIYSAKILSEFPNYGHPILKRFTPAWRIIYNRVNANNKAQAISDMATLLRAIKPYLRIDLRLALFVVASILERPLIVSLLRLIVSRLYRSAKAMKRLIPV